MSEKQSKRQELLALLKDNPLTADELVEKLKIPIEHVRTYISQFSMEGIITKSGKKGRYNLYEIVEHNLIELLKQLYNIMDKRMDFTEKPTELEQKIILKVEELIK